MRQKYFIDLQAFAFIINGNNEENREQNIQWRKYYIFYPVLCKPRHFSKSIQSKLNCGTGEKKEWQFIFVVHWAFFFFSLSNIRSLSFIIVGLVGLLLFGFSLFARCQLHQLPRSKCTISHDLGSQVSSLAFQPSDPIGHARVHAQSCLSNQYPTLSDVLRVMI